MSWRGSTWVADRYTTATTLPDLLQLLIPYGLGLTNLAEIKVSSSNRYDLLPGELVLEAVITAPLHDHGKHNHGRG